MEITENGEGRAEVAVASELRDRLGPFRKIYLSECSNFDYMKGYNDAFDDAQKEIDKYKDIITSIREITNPLKIANKIDGINFKKTHITLNKKDNLSKEWTELYLACGGWSGIAKLIGVGWGNIVRNWAIQKTAPLDDKQDLIKNLCIELDLPFPQFLPPVKVRRGR